MTSTAGCWCETQSTFFQRNVIYHMHDLFNRIVSERVTVVNQQMSNCKLRGERIPVGTIFKLWISISHMLDDLPRCPLAIFVVRSLRSVRPLTMGCLLCVCHLRFITRNPWKSIKWRINMSFVFCLCDRARLRTCFALFLMTVAFDSLNCTPVGMNRLEQSRRKN